MDVQASHFASPTKSVEQREKFSAFGFLVFSNFWKSESVAIIQKQSTVLARQAHLQLKRNFASDTPMADWIRASNDDLIVSPEAHDPTQVCRFECILQASRELRTLVQSQLSPVISGLMCERAVPFKDKQNEKAPGGGAFRPHQDFAAYQSFGPRYHVTAMLSVDSASLKNGCVEFATNANEVAHADAGSVERYVNDRPLFQYHKGGANNGDIRDDIAEQFRWEPVATQPNDLVLFDSFVPHRSAKNDSASSRRAIFLTFNAAEEGDWYARYYREKRSHYNDPKFHVSTPTTFLPAQ
jgi:ectoine hydroxylase-related dioxygenase (phytanoyl-CoA dioxygenase family)